MFFIVVDIIMGLVLVMKMEDFGKKGWFMSVIYLLVTYHIYKKVWHVDL